MSSHLPVEHLMSYAVFGLADLLGVQGAGYLGGLGAAGLAEYRQ
jgi:hypothetical protein